MRKLTEEEALEVGNALEVLAKHGMEIDYQQMSWDNPTQMVLTVELHYNESDDSLYQLEDSDFK